MAEADIKNDMKSAEAAADEIVVLAKEKAGW
jgi:hypothetical protein